MDTILTTSPLNTQVGGSHYKTLSIQPVEYAEKNNLSFLEGQVIKYTTRWRKKGGLDDLKKARHCIDMLIHFNFGEQKDV